MNKINIPRISINAWTVSHATAHAVRETYANRHLVRVKTHSVAEGEPQEVIAHYTDTQTPDLLIIELALDENETRAFINRLKSVCSSKTKVVLIGRINDVRFYQEMMSEGVSEYMLGPVNEEKLVETIGKIYHTSYADNAGRLVLFFGATGGAGSSTLAQHTAWATAELHDTPTLLADLDIAWGAVQLYLNGPEGGQDISHALFTEGRVEETFVSQIIMRLTNRLDVLQSPASLDRPLEFDQETIDKMMDVLRHSAPHTIVDMPRSWTRWNQSTLALADEIVITTQPDIIGLRNTKNLFQFLQNYRRDATVPRYVINQQGVPKRSEIKVTDFVEAIGTQPLAVIPHDPKNFSMAANEGKTVIQNEASSQLTQIFSDMAADLLGNVGNAALSARLQTKARPAVAAGAGLGGLIGRLTGKKPVAAE